MGKYRHNFAKNGQKWGENSAQNLCHRQRKLGKHGENWVKIGKNWTKMGKLGKNWTKKICNKVDGYNCSPKSVTK